MFSIVNHQGNANHSHSDIPPIPIRMAIRMLKKRNHFTLLMRIGIGMATMENNVEVPQKIKNRTTV